jgi:predicted kinase
MKSIITFIDFSRPRLFILAGMPGSGKSTWARTFFSPWQIISSDEIREDKWPGEKYDAARNEEVFKEFHRRIADRLGEGKDVVVDATSLTYQARQRLSDLAAYYDAEKHLIFFNNPHQALHRNVQRSERDRVPPAAQTKMLAKFKESCSAILDEFYTTTTIIEAT